MRNRQIIERVPQRNPLFLDDIIQWDDCCKSRSIDDLCINQQILETSMIVRMDARETANQTRLT